MHTMQQTHQVANGQTETKKLLSHQRQLEYRGRDHNITAQNFTLTFIDALTLTLSRIYCQGPGQSRST